MSHGLTKKDAADYGPWAAVVREKITTRTAKFVVTHHKGTDIFEYDDSSERRDQLRNAFMLAVAMQDKGDIRCIVDLVTNPERPYRVVYKGGLLERQ